MMQSLKRISRPGAQRVRIGLVTLMAALSIGLAGCGSSGGTSPGTNTNSNTNTNLNTNTNANTKTNLNTNGNDGTTR